MKGNSKRQIASVLALSVNTVHAYVKSLFNQVDVHSRGEFMAAIIEDLEMELWLA